MANLGFSGYKTQILGAVKLYLTKQTCKLVHLQIINQEYLGFMDFFVATLILKQK